MIGWYLKHRIEERFRLSDRLRTARNDAPRDAHRLIKQSFSRYDSLDETDLLCANCIDRFARE